MTGPLTFERGMLVSVADGEGFAIMKVLAVDDGGVHARLYAQRFAARPAHAELLKLSTDRVGEGQPFSIGHMPLSHTSFNNWQPQVVALAVEVSEEELEGYRMWEEA